MNQAETLRKFRIRTTLFMTAYVAVNVAAITGAFDGAKPPGTWGLAMAVTAPIIGQIWSMLAWMRDSDEFIRAIAAKRFIVATGVAVGISSMWGFMELFAGTRHISAAMFYPLLMVSFALVTPFIKTSH